MFNLMVPLIALALAAPGTDPTAPIWARLAQARTYAKAEGNHVWPGYGTAPFGFLLLTPEREILLCRDGAPAGFAAAGKETLTRCPRFTRARSALPGGLLAAMPLFGPPSTIVMGTPSATGRSEADWLRTILHEHFHQWQSTLPNYYSRIEALDLAGGDRTGMWMLNYAFPYEDPAVGSAYASASRALAEAIEARGSPDFSATFGRYLAARRSFASAAGERNWRYLELELWQEGVARWTEIRLGRVYPDPEVRRAAAALEVRTLDALKKPELARQGRELAYPLGAGEAMLLETCGPAWRGMYPRVLALGPLLEAAKARCDDRGGAALKG